MECKANAYKSVSINGTGKCYNIADGVEYASSNGATIYKHEFWLVC